MSALFFIESTDNNKFTITGNDARHIIKSLRMSVGESISACDLFGIQHDALIERIEDDRVICNIVNSYPSKGESDVYITLYQAMAKGDKMDLITQKAVELGVSKIVPVITNRCIARPDPKKDEKKRNRLTKIAIEAAMQSRRGKKPEIGSTLSLKQAVDDCKTMDINVVFYEKGGDKIKDTIKKGINSIGIFIGSEGGFDEEEIEYLKLHGIIPLTLGNRILRTETAPLAAISIIMYITDNI